MIYIAFFQLKHIFTSKIKLIMFNFLLFLSLFQIFRLNNIFNQYDVRGGLLDYILFTIGGMESPTLFSYIINWLILILIFIYISLIVSTFTNNLSIFILNRISSRFKLWIITCITQFILSLVSFIILFIVFFFIGGISFGFNLNPSEYTKLFYPNWYFVNTKEIFIYIFMVFTSGLYAIQMILQVNLLLSDNRVNLFIGYIIIAIITSVFHIYFEIPRYLSPFFYPSTVILNISNIGFAVILNIFVIFIFTILGCLIFTKKDIKQFNVY